MRLFEPGDVAVRREVLHGRVWSEMPTRVVADSPDLLAVFVEPGTPLNYPEHHYPHPWDKPSRGFWRGNGKLMLHRPGDAYSVDLFWRGPDRVFSDFYLNLQAPFERTDDGFNTLDHALDYRMHLDGRWEQLDLDEFERDVAVGKYSAAEAEAIRLEGKKIEAMLSSGDIWWDLAWVDWTP
ncbi:hypothetical protein Lesp02_43440 [Lentzea sp. NBRC 105346]|uniref:DUF402 domain-containing protein n=1 Tax=Lentzea sp. NBRC 105346 TaxID=3032205 RepID=UPI0024A481A3|nr:DUF402 domain-containing protein [Lentzea sp. NBRC 105346]GLZ32156.1 hypothetical protein Lesp02_43440 [Lentzea sp. NBRC 105346]